MKMNAIERTERREQIKATKAHLEIVVEVFKATREETPAATVAELVNRLGYETAREAVAELVNRLGYETAREAVAELVNTVEAWDGRIYEYVREWAQSVETASTHDELRSHDIYQPGDIHPAHINQIGEAMREYTPAEEVPAEEPADPAADLAAMLNPAEDLGTEKTVTITITESDAKRLYRACKARAHHFLTMQTEDDEMYKINRAVACDFRALAQSIIDQTNIKI